MKNMFFGGFFVTRLCRECIRVIRVLSVSAHDSISLQVAAKRGGKKQPNTRVHVHVRQRAQPRPPADLKRLEVIPFHPCTISAYIQKVMADCGVAATATRGTAVSLATTARDSAITCQINSLSLLLLPPPSAVILRPS